MHIRLARPADAEAIRAIYNAEVIGSTATFDLVPRTPDEQLAWLADHRGPYPAIVAVDDEGVVLGFGSLSAYRDRPAYATTVENSVYVDAGRRGAGVGRSLLDELVVLAEPARVPLDHRPHRRATTRPPSRSTWPAASRWSGVEREVGPEVQPVARRVRPPAPCC